MTQPNSELSASNVPKSGEVVETQSTTLASIPKPSDAQTPIDKAMDAVARQQFDSLVKNWPSLLNDKPEILAAFGSTAAAADFLKRCYEGGNKANGNLQYNSLWGNEILDYIRTTKNPTPDGLKNFAIGLRKAGQGTLETTISEAKLRGRFAGRIDGAELGKWINDTMPQLKKSGFSLVEIATLKAQIPTISGKDAQRYLDFVKTKKIDFSAALEVLTLANGEVVKAQSYADLYPKAGYSFEQLNAVIPYAEKLGISNLAKYLRGIDPAQALDTLTNDIQLGYQKEIATAAKTGLDFSHYAIERLRAADKDITPKAIAQLVGYGFTNNEIENFICDEKFPWERIAVAEQSTTMHNFLGSEFSWLTKDILSLDPMVFDKAYGEFSQDENYKKVAGTKLFAATLVNYVQKFGADALAQSREAVSVYTAGVEGGVKLSLDEAQELTARSPDYEPKKVMAFINAVHAARPDFYSQVSNFNGNVNLVTIFSYAQGDGDIAKTMTDIKTLEEAGFSPMEICVAAQRGKKSFSKNRTLSFSVLVNDLIAYKNLHPEYKNDEVVATFGDAYTSVATSGDVYLRMDVLQSSVKTAPEAYAHVLASQPRFASAFKVDPDLPNKLYSLHNVPGEILDVFNQIIGSGIDINPKDFPRYIENAKSNRNLVSGIAELAGIVDYIRSIEGLSAVNKTAIFTSLLSFYRHPNAMSYLEALKQASVPPGEWPAKLNDHAALTTFKKIIAVPSAQGVASL